MQSIEIPTKQSITPSAQFNFMRDCFASLAMTGIVGNF